MVEGNKGTFRKGCFTGVVVGAVVTIGVMSVYAYFEARKKPLVFDQAVTPLGRRVPDVIIIGVRKGGTKALITMLNLHPQIVAARGEVHFFDSQDRFEKQGIEWYISRMPLCSESELIIEKTPSYFVTPDVPQKIATSLPQTLKLVLIVRHPVLRTVSDYTQLDVKKISRKKVRPSFENVVFTASGEVRNATRVISDSLYDIHYKKWLQYFDSHQILVVDGDELIKNPLNELLKVESYLNVKSYFSNDKFYYDDKKGFYCWTTGNGSSTKCLGSAKGRNHLDLSEDTNQKLKSYFKPHMLEFCKMANLNFSLCHL